MTVDAHDTTLGASALGFASGEVMAKARWGAASQISRAHATCRKTLSARRPVHSNTKRVSAAARQDVSRRG
jgi:hypothetical protein